MSQTWHEGLPDDIDKMYQKLQKDIMGDRKKRPAKMPPKNNTDTLKDSQQWAKSLLTQLEGEITPPKNSNSEQNAKMTNLLEKTSLSFEGELSDKVKNLPKSTAKSLLKPHNEEPEDPDEEAWAAELLKEIDQLSEGTPFSKKQPDSKTRSTSAKKKTLSFTKIYLERTIPKYYLTSHFWIQNSLIMYGIFENPLKNFV